MRSTISNQLTGRQLEILQFIVQFIDAHGFPPTIREIGEGMRLSSTNGIMDHLKALERKGRIRRKRGLSRALVVISAA